MSRHKVRIEFAAAGLMAVVLLAAWAAGEWYGAMGVLWVVAIVTVAALLFLLEVAEAPAPSPEPADRRETTTEPSPSLLPMQVGLRCRVVAQQGQGGAPIYVAVPFYRPSPDRRRELEFRRSVHGERETFDAGTRAFFQFGTWITVSDAALRAGADFAALSQGEDAIERGKVGGEG